MTGETGTLLSFFKPDTCVICGAETAHQYVNDPCDGDTTHSSESVQAERQEPGVSARTSSRRSRTCRRHRTFLRLTAVSFASRATGSTSSRP